MRRWLLLILIAAGGLLVWAMARRSAPPEVPFVRVSRGQIVSTLNTNGKVEPVEWTAIRAEQAGTIQKLLVERGQQVSRGQVIAQLDSSGARAQLAAAEAKIAAARAEQQVITSGGRSAEIAEIESGLQKARAELAVARREHDSLRRLLEKNAATRADVDAARTRVQAAELQIAALERRRASLVSAPDRAAAGARVQGAQAEARAARESLSKAVVRSPMAGTLYHIESRQGAFVNPGDLIANVGRLDRLRVIVYVDEPELGRVETGMPVTITWDALPGQQWKGTVEKTPTQVIALGTRQVGEVICIIDNTGGTLVPGTNVNAEIQSRVVRNALVIPREVLLRKENEMGVMKLRDGEVVWQPVQLGATSVTSAQVTAGLAETDAVALPVDRTLNTGDTVKPVFPNSPPLSAQ